MTVEVIRAPTLGRLPHGFLGRRGGVSTGALEGLNVGTGSSDDREAIAENRRRAVDAVAPGAKLVTVHQVHSPTCVYVEAAWELNSRPRADAMVTDREGLLLGVLTADCAPVLFADQEAGVIGAAHAGWRGALAGVIDSTVEAMERLAARRDHIAAAVGPCIGQNSYEVDEAFRDGFMNADPTHARFFVPGSSGKPHFDLEAYVQHRLLAVGVGQVETMHLDTYADPNRFYSYRKAIHRGEADYGRQLSALALG